MGVRKAGIEITIDDKGSATLSTLAETVDAVAIASDRAKASHERRAQAERALMDEAAKRYIPTNVDLSKSISKIGGDSVQAAGNIFNFKTSLDALGDSGASATEKMLASAGVFASATGAMKSMREVSDELRGAWDKAGGALSGLLKADVGMGGLVAVSVAAGLELKKVIDLTAELTEVTADAADAEARANERTRHQADALKFLAKEMGTTVQGLKDQGIGLENINRLIKEDPYGKLAQAVKAWRGEVEQSNRVQQDAAKIMAAAEKAGNAEREKATAEILKQHGILTRGDIEQSLSKISHAWNEMGKRIGDADKAASILWPDVQKILDGATKSGVKLDAGWQRWIDKIKTSAVDIVDVDKILSAMRAREQRAVAENTAALAAQKAAADAYYQSVIAGSQKWQAEMAAFKAMAYGGGQSDLTSGDNEIVSVNRNDAAIKVAAARLKGQGPTGASAAQALLEGDLTKLAAIAQKLGEDFARLTGPTASASNTGSFAAAGKAANLAQSIQDIILMLRQGQTAANTTYAPARGSESPASTPSGGVITAPQSVDWGMVAKGIGSEVARSLGSVKTEVKVNLDGRQVAASVARILNREGVSFGSG